MLNELALRNFKLFDEDGTTIKLGKITVFIGPNGTGKTSLLQALLLLKQSIGYDQLRLSTPFIDLGSFKDIVHKQDDKRYIEMKLSVSYPGFFSGTNIPPFLPGPGSITYQSKFTSTSIEQHLTIKDNNRKEIRFTPLEPTTLPLEKGTTADCHLWWTIGNFQISSIAMQGGKATSLWTEEAIRNSINTILSELNASLQNFYFVPAIRGFDKFSYDTLPQEPPLDLTTSSASPQGKIDQATILANVIASSYKLTDQVTQQLHAILNTDTALRHRLIRGKIESEMVNELASINLTHEAFGLNQIIAPLVWLNRIPKESVIGIEEPEIHLHPRAQAALSGLFAEIAAHEQKQLILTTHSEHMLMGLLATVATGLLQPEDLVVYEFSRNNNAAHTERLEVNQYGQITGGLKGFLEVDMEEIGNLIQARFERKLI